MQTSKVHFILGLGKDNHTAAQHTKGDRKHKDGRRHVHSPPGTRLA